MIDLNRVVELDGSFIADGGSLILSTLVEVNGSLVLLTLVEVGGFLVLLTLAEVVDFLVLSTLEVVFGFATRKYADQVLIQCNDGSNVIQCRLHYGRANQLAEQPMLVWLTNL